MLINAGTAGPSEGLAMVLKEKAAAVLMGEKSYGMGLEQEMITLEDGSGLILSTSRYMTQDGTAWNRTGITPSIEIKSEVAEIEKQMEEQLKKAFDYISKDRASKIKKAA
jgi:carboxyl-terminal processing protease